MWNTASMNITIRWCLIVLSAALWILPRPATAERPERGERSGRATTQPMGRGGYFGRFNESDWNEVLAFMKENSPNRFDAYQKLPEASSWRGQIRGRMMM